MEELPDLPAGVYRHYRGPLYLVLGYARDSTNGHETRPRLVAYIGLELTGGARPGPRILVREATEFHALVDPATGEPQPVSTPTAADGPRGVVVYVPRFTYVGPGWDGSRRPPLSG